MTEILTIERMSYGDDAIAHAADGKTVFVSGAVTGDTVEAEVVEGKASFARARTVRIVEASPQRVDPPINAPATASGWASLSYDAQLDAKRENLASALARIAKLPADLIDGVLGDVVPSPRQWGYRNKIELSAAVGSDGKLHLGPCLPGSGDIAEENAEPLAHKAVSGAPKALRGALRFLQQRDDLHLFRVGVRHSDRTGSCEIALWTKPCAMNRALAAKTLASALPATSIVRVLADPGAARKVKKVEVLSGKGFWEEELAGPEETLAFLTSAPSFFQVNTEQAETLVSLAIEGLGGAGALDGMRICDLYAGGGTFGLHLAALGADVTAVESLGSSVRDLRRNAEENGLGIDVVGGDAARELGALGPMDGLVVDPPRAGLAESVVRDIAALGVPIAVYVSCDPQTLARDIARFTAAGYRPARIIPVDLFPQTFHCETVCVLAR